MGQWPHLCRYVLCIPTFSRMTSSTGVALAETAVLIFDAAAVARKNRLRGIKLSSGFRGSIADPEIPLL